jgi:AcrR family transcriptional regulator
MAVGASQARGRAPRERMVHSAVQLIRRQGVSGTGMREIVTEAGAPRGSLQHYFPGGKEELVSDALVWAGDLAARRIKRSLSELEPRTPSALLVSVIDDWRRDLTNEHFSAGCPLVAAAADTAATSEQLRQVVRRAFDGWLEPLSESLVELGVPPERSNNLAVLVIAALEGAIILARIRRDLTPFDALVVELGPLLDAVAHPVAAGVATGGLCQVLGEVRHGAHCSDGDPDGRQSREPSLASPVGTAAQPLAD